MGKFEHDTLFPANERSPGTRSPLEDAVWLGLVPGIGPLLRKALIEKFGTPSAVFAAAPSELRAVDGIGPKLTTAICKAREEIDAAAEIELCQRQGVTILTLEDPTYPEALKHLPDSPGVLYVRGEIKPQDLVGIAIVGSRHATNYGLRQAERLAESLSRAGFTITSGLARGIDGKAHAAAIAAGGRTLAVLGSGVLNIYPPEHGGLAREVMAHGALISEQPPRAQPLAGAFPQRNRLISGLSLGVIVVEAALGSGALITARHAMEQGREVFAVPGPVDSRVSHGCHRLIRDGAKLVETADDVLEELGPLVAPAPRAQAGPEIHHPVELLLNEPEKRVLSAIGSSPTTVDNVVVASGLPVPQVLATLSVLEMRRVVRRLSGNSVVRM